MRSKNINAAEKSRIRADLLAARARIDSTLAELLERRVCAHLADWLKTRTSVTRIFLYSAMRREVDVLPLAAMLPQLTYALPVTNEKNMEFYNWSLGSPLAAGQYGILEPKNDGVAPMIADRQTVILVPCLAVSLDGVRLGYGGGYYDRYLSRKKITTVGVVAKDFIRQHLPKESHDQILDWVATEDGVLKLPIRSQI